MSEQRGTKAEIRKLRQELGLCVDCGEPLETQTRSYRLPPIRCAACRERETQRKYALKRIQEQQEARRIEEEKRTRVDYMPPHSVCETCIWATFTGGGTYFCPLSVCVRVKLPEELKSRSANGENALDNAENALDNDTAAPQSMGIEPSAVCDDAFAQ